MQKFTDLTIRSLPPGTHFDERTPGFGIRVGKRRKTWIVLKGPRARRVQTILGHYPALGLADARKKALVALGSRLEARTAPKFPDALEAFLAQDRWKASSKYEIERTLRRYFSWTRTLDKITHEDVAQAIESVKAKSEAAHALKDLKTFFNWCVPRYLAHSPCTGLKPPAPYKPRKRVLADEELKRVWLACNDMGVYGAQVQCLVTTGQRVNQIISFDPRWIGDGIIVFPAEIMKSGREHTIPLGKLTATLLPKLRQTTYQGKLKRKLDKDAEVSNWTLHDLRRVFSTGLASLKVPQHVTERLLDHSSAHVSEVAEIYNLYTYLPEMRAAIELWEVKLQTLLNP